jgi:hypothetical protein
VVSCAEPITFWTVFGLGWGCTILLWKYETPRNMRRQADSNIDDEPSGRDLKTRICGPDRGKGLGLKWPSNCNYQPHVNNKRS